DVGVDVVQERPTRTPHVVDAPLRSERVPQSLDEGDRGHHNEEPEKQGPRGSPSSISCRGGGGRRTAGLDQRGGQWNAPRVLGSRLGTRVILLPDANSIPASDAKKIRHPAGRRKTSRNRNQYPMNVRCAR